MKQMSLCAGGFERKTKRTRKREFLDEMNLVVPWAELVSLIAPHAPQPGLKSGRPPFAVATLLRIHFLQPWFNLSDPAMEEALYDTPMFREFAGLDMGEDHLPDESTILRFRHLLETHNLSLPILASVNAMLSAKGLLLKQGTVVDATLIAAPCSTKNSTGTRDPEMHQTKKGNQWHHGMKAHIGSDAELGLVHSVATTAANAHDITQAHALLHGQDLMFELGAVAPTGLGLGFSHGVHLSALVGAIVAAYAAAFKGGLTGRLPKNQEIDSDQYKCRCQPLPQTSRKFLIAPGSSPCYVALPVGVHWVGGWLLVFLIAAP